MNTETTHPQQSTGLSQCDRLEKYFRAHPNEWLDSPDLAQVMTDGTGVGTIAGRRVYDLRHTRGMNIEQKSTLYTEDEKQIHVSRYRFLPAPVLAPMTPANVLDGEASVAQESTGRIPNHSDCDNTQSPGNGTLAAGNSLQLE